MTVLVSAASKHGATDEIASRVGAGLAERGIDVVVRRLSEVDNITTYDAVVLGSAIYFGRWMREARAFVSEHASEFAERPTWLFGSGSVVGSPPPNDDPNAIRPAHVNSLVSSTRAREHKLFAGKLDSRKLSLAEKLPVRLVGGREGDHRDWREVDAWAASIAEELNDPRHATHLRASESEPEGGRGR